MAARLVAIRSRPSIGVRL